MKKAIQIGLAIIIIVLAVFIIDSIMQPIRFKSEKDIREAATIERLRHIRTAQVAFRSKYDRYTPSFDSLIHFIKNDSFIIEKNIGTYDLDAMTLRQAIRSGFVRVEKTNVSVKDSLFKGNFIVDSIQYVPFTNQVKFEMAADKIRTGGLTVPVFEAKVHNDILLAGLDRQLVVNYNDERKKKVRYAGLKVGSIEESNNNAGNWE